MRLFHCGLIVFSLVGNSQVVADEAPISEPKPIPQSRPEMKRAIESLKQRQPRLPLPPLTAEEAAPDANGEPHMVVNNGRMRQLYLPQEWQQARNRSSAGRSGNQDPAMTLDDTFKVRLFWIVSRSNNCHYCLGHQELKLRNAGMADDEVAALDSDWEVYPADERAAMEFTRRCTLVPHQLTAQELDKLRSQYTNSQWIELTHTVANFNSTNRWTDSMGIPQDHKFRDQPSTLDTPTSTKYSDRPTCIFADLELKRLPLESRADVEAALSACHSRTPRVEVPSEADARKVIPAEIAANPLPQWMRVLSIFPQTGIGQIKTRHAMQTTGKLPSELKAKLAWTSARQNRAWYATGMAQEQLKKLGLSDDAIFALDADKPGETPAEQEALAFCRKLTASPQQIADADIARLRKLYSDHEVAEIVQVTCVANSFDRFTEVLNLAL